MDTKLNNNIKLEEVATQYSKFDKNQVLTETQLNGFLDYFDDQHRMTRTSLSGVGIVCGFKLNYALQEVQIDGETKTEYRLKITQGRGVTTDGDLLALQKELPAKEGRNTEILKSIDLLSKTYGYCKSFIDDNAKYEHFIKEDEKQIPLWELHENQDQSASLTRIQDLEGIDDMIVLLYLENYAKNGDLCTKLSCDNQGIAQVAKLKVLLVSLDDAKYIVSQDSIYNKHNWFETYKSLPVLQAKRVVLTCENTKTLVDLKKNYAEAIKSNNTVQKLGEGLDTILAKFQQRPASSRITSIFSYSNNAIPSDFQYRYDVLKDLIDTYNDIKELLLHLNVDCCPNIGSFPKHLMLGKLKEEAPFLSFRHQFYKAPIIGHDDENYQKVISLLKRIKELTFNYKFANKGTRIKVTPSRVCGELQEKAIPFYYNVGESLLTQWSFQKTQNFKQKYNLSYHKENLANVPSIQRPLEYSLDCFNFYRIEGHQGKMYREALEEIFKIRNNQGLSFDVKALSINTSNKEIDIHKYKCQFEDLSLLLNAWKAEQKCILKEVSKFLSEFKLDKAGEHFSEKTDKEYKYGTMATATGMTGTVRDAGDLATAMEEMKRVKSARVMMTEYPMAVEYTTQKELLRNNIIKEGLSTQEGTLGEVLHVSFAENEYGSSNDILAHFGNAVEDVKASQMWAEEPELGEFVFKDIPELLVNSYVLEDTIPESILNFDEVTLENYQHTIETLCALVKRLQTKYQSLKINQGYKQIIALLINQLSSVCCSGKKLELLQTEILKRRDQILIQIQLSEFVKKHPGLEHKAGVVPGGTFLLVYLTGNEKGESFYERKTLEIEFEQQPIIDEKGLTGEEGFLNLWDERVSTRFVFMRNISKDTKNPFSEIVSIGKSIEETVSNFAAFLNEKWKLAGVNNVRAIAEGNRIIIGIQDRLIPEEAFYIKFADNRIIGGESARFFEKNGLIEENINTENKVVADFCLPFMFKSDCAPVNFIIPKEPVVLRLPQPFVCLKEEDAFEPLIFEKSPANLEIKAKVPEGMASGLTKNENGDDVFDARLTDESLYRKAIEFTLGGEETDCVVTVYPDVDISVSREVVYNNGNTRAIVTYLVSEVMPNLRYAWDFGKGNISNQKPNQEGKITREYPLLYNEENRIEPKLIISNGFCEKEILIDPVDFETSIDASLSIEENYCLDIESAEEVKLPFTNLNPANGKIEIVEQGINGLRIEGAFLVITPNKFKSFEKEIRFTIDGLSTNAKITIRPKVAVTIVSGVTGDFGKNGDYNWVGNTLHYGYSLSVRFPENTNESELTFEWILNDKKVSNESSYTLNVPLKEEAQDINIRTIVTHSNGCSSETSMSIQIVPYPVFTLQLPENKLEYCLNDKRSYIISIAPNIQGTVVKGLGVSKNPNGGYQFTPSATKLTTAGTVQFSVGGKQLLTIKLKDVPKADFTANVENKELILTNTSDLADKYIWNIGGQEVVRTNRIAIRRKVDSFETSDITVSLIAIGICGQSPAKIESVKVRENERESSTPCIDGIKAVIKNDRTKLSKNIDVSQDILKNVITPTITAYDTILKSPNSIYEGGSNSAILQGMVRLFSQTGKYMFKNRQNSYVFGELTKAYIAQTKLIFNTIHCQSYTVLEKDQRLIVAAMNQMKKSLEIFKEQDVVFDTNNELKNYLNQYSNDAKIISYIRKGIKSLLIAEIL